MTETVTAAAPVFAVTLPPPLAWLAPLADRALGLSPLQALYRERPAGLSPAGFIAHALQALPLAYTLRADAGAEIPAEGPLLVVANHPSGAADGLVLADLLLRRRGDLRILANRWLAAIPELQPLVLAVDVFRPGANGRALRAALRHLRGGGALLMFPAGAVSQLQLGPGWAVSDPPWAPGVAELALASGASVLPAHLAAAPLWPSLLAGRLHPRLRTACLPRDLLRQRGRTLEIALAPPLPATELARLPDAARADYLRLLVEALAPLPAATAARPLVPLVAAVAPARLAAALAALPASARLLGQGALSVYRVPGEALGVLGEELGRLRELAFRAAGEGSGLACDRDAHDRDYEHLLLWHETEQRLLGAYRLGFTTAVVARRGLAGLYTHSLFDYGEALLAHLGPSLELGRSFVVPDQQRSFAALRLLWRGIARVLEAHPELRYLFGPVSISARYSRTGRALMELALSRHHADPVLSRLVRPRTPARPSAGEPLRRSVAAALADPALLSAVVGRIERGSGLPVLLRHYLELRGRFAGFNVDAAFGDTLDGLVFVPVAELPARWRR